MTPESLKACRDALDAELEYKYKLIAENEDLKNEIARLENLVYVPGLWKCAKCGCFTISTNLHVNTGGFSANNTPQQCPNNCGPMWRVTERAAGNEVCDKMAKLKAPLPALEELRDAIVGELEKMRPSWLDVSQAKDIGDAQHAFMVAKGNVVADVNRMITAQFASFMAQKKGE